jgi:hypothetical protein
MVNIENRFLDFEEEYQTFEIKIEGTPIWERIRDNVFREIITQIRTRTGSANPSSYSTIDLLKSGRLWIQNLVSKNPYRAPSSDIMFVGLSRRKKGTDDLWWDIYCDPIHDDCSLNTVHFERPYQFDHLTPTKTDSVRYLELIDYTGSILRRLGFPGIKIGASNLSRLQDLEDGITQQFNLNINITSMVRRYLKNRKIRLPLYKRLIDTIEPEIVVVVVSETKDLIIEACKLQGVPTVELQHGITNKVNMAYEYPDGRTKEIFPDYFLAFGEFWATKTEFPIPDSRVIPVGYPYLEQNYKRFDISKSSDQILFVSQKQVGRQLSKFAVELYDHLSADYDLVYKLHPGEYDLWQQEYPWLENVDFKIIDGPEPGLYSLFAKSAAQVGVSSTAIYEGAAFGLETFLYDIPRSRVIQPLVDEGVATRISSPNEFIESLKQEQKSFNYTHFFEENATKNMCEMIKYLKQNGTQYVP